MPYDPFKLYSRRQAEAKGEIPDVYEYDEIPSEFRVQACLVIKSTFDKCQYDQIYYRELEKEFAKRIGLFHLGGDFPINNIIDYIQRAEDIGVLDILDFILHVYYNLIKSGNNAYTDTYINSIEQVNYWLHYNNLGYEFMNGEIIRADNKVLHKEVVKPSLLFLSDPRFAGANQEMLAAYETRRNGNNADALVNANRAFESVMKSICDEKGYTYDPQKSTTKDLINILKTEEFYPAYMNPHIDGIRITLESGLPVVRNKKGGHGQGKAVTPVPDEFVDYALNLAATNILFFARLLGPALKGSTP